MNCAYVPLFTRQDTLSWGCAPGFVSPAAEAFCGLMPTGMAIVSWRITSQLPRRLAYCNRWQVGSPKVDG
jgi:hypothetical protein